MAIRRIICVLMLSAAPTAAHAQQPDAGTYRALLEREQAGDTTVDYHALRMAYAASPEYSPYSVDTDEQRDSMQAALNRGELERARAEAERVLAIDWLNVEAHMVAAYAAEAAGDTAAAWRHRYTGARLVQSVTGSGEGTVSSPYVVVTIQEEYAVLYMLGYERREQSLVPCGESRCDRLVGVHVETGEERTFHFDIGLPWAYMRKQIQGGGGA